MELAAMLQAVEDTVGVDYREILAEMAALRTRLGGLRQELKAGRQQVEELTDQLGELRARRASDAAARDVATAAATRPRAVRHLAGGVFAADSGLEDLATFQATLSGSDGVRAALDAARRSRRPGRPSLRAEQPGRRAAPAVGVGACLPRHAERRADLDLETDEDVQVFSAVVNGVRAGAAELLHVLRDEADRSRQEITDAERELFDQTLTGDTRRHLADGSARPMAGGPDECAAGTGPHGVQGGGPAGLAGGPGSPAGHQGGPGPAAQGPGPADRRGPGVAAPLLPGAHRAREDRRHRGQLQEEQLAQVFDYTAWHQFVVKVDRANGTGWQLLTRNLHGALSGGEKAIALHLPLFAAVAAHTTGRPGSFRIILLDEVSSAWTAAIAARSSRYSRSIWTWC